MNFLNDISNGLARNIARVELEKEIFDMVYGWGRVGIVVDHTCPAFKESVTKLEALCANTQ